MTIPTIDRTQRSPRASRALTIPRAEDTHTYTCTRIHHSRASASPSRVACTAQIHHHPRSRISRGRSRSFRSIIRALTRDDAYLRLAKQTTGGPTENRTRRVRVQFRRAPSRRRRGLGRGGFTPIGADDRGRGALGGDRSAIGAHGGGRRHRVSRGERKHRRWWGRR
jgi:hypothetical protein